jgi:SAM-dependent methyltransferase
MMTELPPDSNQHSGAFLGDTPERSYAGLLRRFTRFAAPEIQRLIDSLDLEPGSWVLDAGCGAGGTTAWLAEAVGTRGAVVAMDLSHPHCLATRSEAPRGRVVQADLLRHPFRPGRFDLVWTMNTLNHLESPASGCRALGTTLRRGGRLVAVQGHFLPEMLFAWDDLLERAVTDACCRAYLERYGRDLGEMADQRRLLGALQDAGLRRVRARTVVIERQQPLSPDDRDYFLHTVFRGHWGPWLHPYLTGEQRRRLERLCDPDSPEFCLDRPDFHHLQTLTAVTGEVP